MRKRDEDVCLRGIALEYARRYGVGVRSEAAALKDAGEETDRLDARVARRLRAARLRRARIAMGAVAAACLLLLAVPRLLPGRLPGEIPPADGSADSPAGGLPPAATSAPLAVASLPPAAATPTGAPGGTGHDTDAIPLAFALPDRFTVASVEQDRDETVYRLADARGDDVVLTCAYAGDARAYEGLEAIPLDGDTAYGRYGADFSVLCFERGGIAYALTCRHDLNTLLALAGNILI